MISLNRKNQSGFTIVELLLAMAFFSFILIFFSLGFIQINRLFQRGQTIKRVTQTGRAVIEDVSRNIRLSSADKTILMTANADGVNRLCLSNGTHYGWNVIDSGNEHLIEADGSIATDAFTLVQSASHSVCGAPFELKNAPENAGVDDEVYRTLGVTSLLDDGIVVQAFTVTKVPGVEALRIDIALSTADLDPDDSISSISGDSDTGFKCSGYAGHGDEYCDVIRLSTIVNFRLP